MAKDDETEEPSLEEAAGYSVQIDKSELKDNDNTFLKCSPKVSDNEETKKEENNHRLVKRILNDVDYSSQASAIVIDKETSDKSDDTCVCERGSNQLIGYEDSDGTWKLRWEIEKPESEEDFIALCLLGKRMLFCIGKAIYTIRKTSCSCSEKNRKKNK